MISDANEFVKLKKKKVFREQQEGTKASLTILFSKKKIQDLELENESCGLGSIPWTQFPAVYRDIAKS